MYVLLRQDKIILHAILIAEVMGPVIGFSQIQSYYNLTVLNWTPALSLCESSMKYKSNQVYLGVALDQSLNFQGHLKKTAAKARTSVK